MAARRRRQSDDQYVRAVRRARTRGERIQAGALRVAFRLQAIRVARRLVDEGGSLQLAFDGTSRGLITRAMLDSPQATARVVADIAGVFIGLDDPLPANSPILTSLRRIGARRITMVNQATRRAARRHIVLGVRERLGTYELAYGGTSGRARLPGAPAGAPFARSCKRPMHGALRPSPRQSKAYPRSTAHTGAYVRLD